MELLWFWAAIVVFLATGGGSDAIRLLLQDDTDSSDTHTYTFTDKTDGREVSAGFRLNGRGWEPEYSTPAGSSVTMRRCRCNLSFDIDAGDGGGEVTHHDVLVGKCLP